MGLDWRDPSVLIRMMGMEEQSNYGAQILAGPIVPGATDANGRVHTPLKIDVHKCSVCQLFHNRLRVASSRRIYGGSTVRYCLWLGPRKLSHQI
jgi:hypothetical protein